MRYLAIIVLLGVSIDADVVGQWNYDDSLKGAIGDGKGNIWHGVDDDHSHEVGVKLGLEHGAYGGVKLRVVEDEVKKEDNFVRPCALDDWNCVRKFLAKNSKCVIKHGPAPDPLYLKQSTLFVPVTNMTATFTDLVVTGLGNSKINEFYFNKVTGNLVLAIEVTKMNETTPKSYFTYRRTGKETIVLADEVRILYNSIIYTAIIPKKNHELRLDLAEIHADIRDIVPPFYIGPKAYTSTDPDVIKAFAAFIINVQTHFREVFLFKSQLYIAVYIQNYLCDFGLKLYSM